MCSLWQWLRQLQFLCFSIEFIKNFLDGKQRTLEPTNLTLVDDKVKLNQALTEILRSDKVAIDIETNGKLFLKDDIMGIGFALDKENAYYIPLKVYDKDSDTCKNFWEEEVEEKVEEAPKTEEKPADTEKPAEETPAEA